MAEGMKRRRRNWFRDWLDSAWFAPSFRCVSVVESADDIPSTMERNAAVLVGSSQYPKWIAFDCPCGKGHRIMLNLDRSRYPFWSAHQDRDRLSISPSVDYEDECRRCHYFIRNGKVIWVGDSYGE